MISRELGDKAGAPAASGASPEAVEDLRCPSAAEPEAETMLGVSRGSERDAARPIAVALCAVPPTTWGGRRRSALTGESAR